MKWLKRRICRLFYVPKYEKVSEQTISRVIPSSVLGILFCAVCLTALTWAWFSDSVTSGAGHIASAHFSASVTVTQTTEGGAVTVASNDGIGGTSDAALTPSADGSYSLAAGTTYTVTIAAAGDASNGYCEVKIGGQSYHTVQLYPGSTETGKPASLTFTVTASEASTLTVTPHWGTYTKPDSETLIDSSWSYSTPSTAETPTEPVQETEPAPTNNATATEQTGVAYTIAAGDTLTGIAEKYDTSVPALAAYNEIQNPDAIQAGDTIQIPPSDYQPPEVTQEAEATQPPAEEQTSGETQEAEATQPPAEEQTSGETQGTEAAQPPAEEQTSGETQGTEATQPPAEEQTPEGDSPSTDPSDTTEPAA